MGLISQAKTFTPGVNISSILLYKWSNLLEQLVFKCSFERSEQLKLKGCLVALHEEKLRMADTRIFTRTESLTDISYQVPGHFPRNKRKTLCSWELMSCRNLCTRELMFSRNKCPCGELMLSKMFQEEEAEILCVNIQKLQYPLHSTCHNFTSCFVYAAKLRRTWKQ